MSSTGHTPRRIYFLTTILWATGVCPHAAWYVHSILSGPPDQDLYANNWVFQLVAFSFVRLPIWLLLLFSVVLGQFVVIGRRPKQAIEDPGA